MKDPERLVGSGGGAGGGATGLEQILLSAARRESPSPELQLRMARALGLPAAGPVAAPLPPEAMSSTGIKVAATSSGALPWVAAGVLASVVALGFGVRAIVHRSSGGGAATQSVESTSLPAPVAAAPAIEGAAAAQAQVADEVRVLDAARAALRARAPGRALEQLDQYAQRHPRGTLSPEADVLRVEAVSQDGRPEQAAALARAFLAKYPDSPLRARVVRFGGVGR